MEIKVMVEKDDAIFLIELLANRLTLGINCGSMGKADIDRIRRLISTLSKSINISYKLEADKYER